METLSSPLLTFLVNSLWQVPLIAAAGWLASRMMSRGPASHRHTIGILTALAALLLPLSSIRVSDPSRSGAILPGAPTITLPAARNGVSSVATPSVPKVAAAPIHVSLARVTATTAITAYLLLILYRLLVLGTAFLRTLRIRRTSSTALPSPLLEAVWNRTAAALGIINAELRVSSAISGPVMIGGVRKTIILPASLFQETDEQILNTAIGHEMAHIRRHDYEINILTELLCLPISFQPATLLIRRTIVRSRELACDELVTRHLMKPADYARSMVTLAHDAIGVPRPGFSLGVFDGNILEERVKRLLNRRAASFRHARLMLVTGLSALAICIVIASGAAISAKAQNAAMPEMKLAEAAYNSGDFQRAVEHFRSAVNLEPDNVNARLFLADALLSALRSQPGVPGDEGQLEPVLRQYDEVLARDPKNAAAIYGVATLGGPARWQQTHSRLLSLIADDPKNWQAMYTIGVIDWQLVFKGIQQAAGMPPGREAITDMALRGSLRAKYQTTVDEGVRMLQAMLQLSPNNFDAFAYLNLLYREAGALTETGEQSKELTAKADEFVQQALAARRAQGAGRPTPPALNVEAPATLRSMLQAPPPPPPPPPPGYKSTGKP